jgi:uncharacterized protein (DUF3820 family)
VPSKRCTDVLVNILGGGCGIEEQFDGCQGRRLISKIERFLNWVRKVFANGRIETILIKGSILDGLDEGLRNLKLFKGNDNLLLRFLCQCGFVPARRFIWIILTRDGRLRAVFNASNIWLKLIILFIICDTGTPFVIFVVRTSYSNLGPSSPNPSSFLLAVIPSKPPSRIGLPSEF